ncbi:uncharacterized protein F5147DRAFT_678094 [Suillus discolor]|uniref:Uncharacterized protein n=1 Tax=Suillus discolor TaxID=1912936 RepID=A0A9P7FEL7_9AGAM|nr:uncharacterized protein F5147DRAFT_678094 [Suillus discolor]KAG2114144.1 hypothetical protein F5147DRAFT_678094 [Suillus discolor]
MACLSPLLHLLVFFYTCYFPRGCCVLYLPCCCAALLALLWLGLDILFICILSLSFLSVIFFCCFALVTCL